LAGNEGAGASFPRNSLLVRRFQTTRRALAATLALVRRAIVLYSSNWLHGVDDFNLGRCAWNIERLETDTSDSSADRRMEDSERQQQHVVSSIPNKLFLSASDIQTPTIGDSVNSPAGRPPVNGSSTSGIGTFAVKSGLAQMLKIRNPSFSLVVVFRQLKLMVRRRDYGCRQVMILPSFPGFLCPWADKHKRRTSKDCRRSRRVCGHGFGTGSCGYSTAGRCC